jgi:hypothetical protein
MTGLTMQIFLKKKKKENEKFLIKNFPFYFSLKMVSSHLMLTW